jgi:hypothetical protein
LAAERLSCEFIRESANRQQVCLSRGDEIQQRGSERRGGGGGETFKDLPPSGLVDSPIFRSAREWRIAMTAQSHLQFFANFVTSHKICVLHRFGAAQACPVNRTVKLHEPCLVAAVVFKILSWNCIEARDLQPTNQSGK